MDMLRTLRELADRTPPSRERVIDLLRVVAIVAVVLGHWLVSVVEYDESGQLTGRSALPELPWAQPITWIAQVMPLFFLVGGYANAASLAGHRARGGDLAGWLLNRGTRLIRPTTALVLVLAGGAFTAQVLDLAEPELVRRSVWLACIPLWFLSVYLVVVVLTPVMYALHRRFGFAVPVVLVGLVGAGDVARLLGEESWGSGNFLFGWLVIHQMGFFWRDGQLSGRPRVAASLLLGGIAVLSLLTLVGPYPISLINIPGERLHNMSPPSLALLGVAAFQLGLALLLRQRAERWLRHDRPWLGVVAINSVILTIFLWHISAAILAAAVLHAAGLLPTPEVGSASWLAWRLPWLVILSVVLAGLVAVFGPIEMRRGGRPRSYPLWMRGGLAAIPSSPGPRLLLVLIGLAAITVGLIENNLFPPNGAATFGIPTAALVAYLAGAAVLRLLQAGQGVRSAPTT